MEIIWHILLTVCLGQSCLQQDVQWFENKLKCEEMLNVYQMLPKDGDWDTVEYQCKPVSSVSL